MLLLHEHEVRQPAVLRGYEWAVLSSQQHLVSVCLTPDTKFEFTFQGQSTCGLYGGSGPTYIILIHHV